MNPNDLIRVTDLRLEGVHGVLAEERLGPQPFSVDLTLEFDLSRPGQTDEVTDTVSYVDAIEAATKVIEQESHNLLERIAARIAEEVFVTTAATGVEVTVRKLSPPLDRPVGSTSVTIFRTGRPGPSSD